MSAYPRILHLNVITVNLAVIYPKNIRCWFCPWIAFDNCRRYSSCYVPADRVINLKLVTMPSYPPFAFGKCPWCNSSCHIPPYKVLNLKFLKGQLSMPSCHYVACSSKCWYYSICHMYICSIPSSQTLNLKFLKSDCALVSSCCMQYLSMIQFQLWRHVLPYKVLNLKFLKGQHALLPLSCM